MTDTSPALEAIEASGVPHRVVRIEPAPDLATAAARRGVPVSRLLKTMVVRIAEGSHVLVLVPGDRVIDWAALRTHLGVRRVSLADADEAFAATGYRRGTITPIGVRGNLRVVADSAIPGSGEVSIGAGAFGVAVHLDADDLVSMVGADTAAVTKPASG